MRIAILGAVLALLLPACGGGTAATLQSAALQGVVYEVDGQTVDRSGVYVELLETGHSAMTDVGGNFTFTGLRPGTYTLEFEAMDNPYASDTEEGGDEAIHEEDDHEDGEGRPVIEVDENCGEIEIRVALENGEVREFTVDEHEGRHAKALLHSVEGSELDVEGVIKVTELGDRQLFRIQAGRFEPGTVLDIFLDAREGAGRTLVGTAVADADGVATFQRDTGDGDALPLSAESLDDLAGFKVEVGLAESDELLLIGEVPDLPASEEHDCDGEEGDGKDEPPAEEEPDHEASTRGKALLEAWIDGIEGHVEISLWPAEEWQRFRMDVFGLEPGDKVAFEIENPETDGFVRIATRTVNDDGVARIDTDNDLDMPLGATSVKDLIGLRVRIRRAEEFSDDILLDGIVPELVRD